MSDEIPTEAEVRRMRDIAYGTSIADREWNLCRDYWMKPENVEWLEQHQPEE
jgi:hypothetical protein